MGSTNRTIRVFIPFLKATMQVLQELTQEVFIKRNVYTHVGNLNGADYQVEIGIIGDIRSRVIFSFPKPFARELTRIMLDIGDEEIDNQTVEESIQEIGNMVSGNAMGLLEEIGLNSDITPPKLYFSDQKIVGEQAQMGVLEFTSNLGNFQVAIVTNENNKLLKNDVIFSVGFSREIDLRMAKFFFPKGIYLLACSEKNISRLLEQYEPSLIILNSQDPNLKDNLTLFSKLKNIADLPLTISGDIPETFAPLLSSFSPIKMEPTDDPYDFLEVIKGILAKSKIPIYDNRENIVVHVPQDSTHSAFFLINTRRGDQETIPIETLSFDSLLINIANHQYINFPERKNLGPKNHLQIRLGESDTIKIEKAQIANSVSEDLITIALHHILETESQKLTTYMYDVLSE